MLLYNWENCSLLVASIKSSLYRRPSPRKRPPRPVEEQRSVSSRIRIRKRRFNVEAGVFPSNELNVMSFPNIIEISVASFYSSSTIGVLFPAVGPRSEGKVVAWIFVGVEVGIIPGTDGSGSVLVQVVFSDDIVTTWTEPSGSGCVDGFVDATWGLRLSR